LNCEDVVVATLAEPPQWEGGLYRKGKQLVMHKRANLPDRCVKSNQPADGRRLQRNLSWYHPLIYLTLVVSPLVFIIVAYVLRKQATIHVGLSKPWFRKRRRALLIGWLMALLGLAIVVASIMMISNPRGQTPWAGWGIPLGIVMLIGAGIYGSMASQMVSPVRITDDYVWLKGVHPDYLADLPPWPNRP
jgi:uncharacterized membrane protein